MVPKRMSPSAALKVKVSGMASAIPVGALMPGQCPDDDSDERSDQDEQYDPKSTPRPGNQALLPYDLSRHDKEGRRKLGGYAPQAGPLDPLPRGLALLPDFRQRFP